MTNNTVSIYFLYTRGPDGSKQPVAVAENSWLGSAHGWPSGTGVVVNGYDGNQTALPAGSVYKTQTSPDDCDLLNILPCPANIDAAEKRTQFAKAWKEDHAVTANWSRENPHLLVIGDIAIGGRRPAASTSTQSRLSSHDISNQSLAYNGIISGQEPISSYFASIKSEGPVRATDGRTRPMTVTIQPVPKNLLEPSIAWVTPCATQVDAFSLLQNFGTRIVLREIIDVPAWNNGVCHAKWGVSKAGTFALSSCNPPSKKPAQLYYSINDGTETRYGSLDTSKQAGTVFTPKVLEGIMTKVRIGPVSMTGAIDGAGFLYTVSKDPAGLFSGDIQATKAVKMKGDFPWTLEEQHRVILAGLGVE